MQGTLKNKLYKTSLIFEKIVRIPLYLIKRSPNEREGKQNKNPKWPLKFIEEKQFLTKIYSVSIKPLNIAN